MESILDAYFKNDPTWAVKHHLDSYRAFVETKLPDAIRTLNGEKFTETFLNDSGEPSREVTVYVGGLDASALSLVPPKTTPAECRAQMLSYSADLRADIIVRFRYIKEGKIIEKKFDKVRIGSIPIMIGSCACPLEGASAQALHDAGESVGDLGGYFVVGGREKVLITQEEIRTNFLQTRVKDGTLIGLIRCTGDSGESKLYPKTTDIIVNAQGQVSLRLVRFNGSFVPLHTIFRALGVESDREIMEIVSLGETGPWAWVREWLRTSLTVATEGQYSQQAALDAMAGTMRFRSVPEVLKVLVEDLFPNQGDSFRMKAIFLGHLVRQLALAHKGRAPLTDRDAYEYKRLKASGDLMSEQFRNAYNIFRQLALRALRDEHTFGLVLTTGKLEDLVRPDNLSRIFQSTIVEEYMARYMRGVIIKEGTVAESGKEGVVQELSRTNYLSTLSHLRRVRTPIDESLKIREPRALHVQQWGVMCPFETPDGGHCGLLKHLSMVAHITAGSDRAELVASLKRLGMVEIESILPGSMKSATMVFVNGQLMGVVSEPASVCAGFRLERRAGLLDPYASIRWNVAAGEIHVQSNEGRLVRPLLINPLPGGGLAKSDQAVAEAVRKVAGNRPAWMTLLMGPEGRKKGRVESRQALEKHRGIIEYVDIDESVGNTLVSMSVKEVTPRHTHVEIHPATTFSAVGGLSPFVGHNQPARNIYACGQAKQAIGVYATNFRNRVDAVAYAGWGMQLPIVTTRFASCHGNAYPLLAGGQNLVVAISPALGFNQEDSMVLNKASVQRGALRVDVYHGLTEGEGDGKVFINPSKMREEGTYIADLKRAYYGALDENGLPKVGTVIAKDDKCALLGRMKDGVDCSIVSDQDLYGTVDLVQTSGVEGARKVRARLLQTRPPTLGDKLCSRYAQKGVVGLIVDSWKLPRTASGIVPDVFINPHAIPSRMTVGHLIETMLGKACAFEGVIGDATAFMETDLQPIGECLKSRGFAPMGDEILYDSATGAQIQCPIFVGVNHMCRLKLMSEDKINSRGKGPKVKRTMQPAAGRAAGGGLRVGEMERDVICSYGMSSMMRESFMDRSDKYACDVCRTCGGRPNGDVCGSCGSSDLVTVEMPYTFNLMRHELDAAGISTKLITQLPFPEPPLEMQE